MRARTRLGLFATGLILAAVPFAADADTLLAKGQFVVFPKETFPPFLTQTALKPGDPFELDVFGFGDPALTVSADLSSLGISSTSVGASQGPVSGTIGNTTYNNLYVYPILNTSGSATVVGSTTDGHKSIPVTVTDSAGRMGSATASVLIDGALPTVSISSVTFTSPTPQEGDYIVVKGIASGTGSQITTAGIAESAAPISGSGNATGCFTPDGVVNYANPPLLNALATSTDGSFTISLPIFECGNTGWLSAHAGTLTMTITVADEAGNRSSGSLTVPVHQPTGVSSVLFLPGTEASRLYMRNSDGSDHQLWEPGVDGDIGFLAMNPDGTSIFPIFTKDIINSIYNFSSGVAHLDPSDLEVYGDFEHFMDSLVASSTFGLKEWRAYPYDWRYDVQDVVNRGTATEMPDGSIQQVYLEDVLKQMASSSPTGKVTVIGHSNGGLLGKALIEKLTAEGEQGLVDRFVMIGTPQWGTPSAIGAMLHGIGQNHILGLVSYAPDVRAAASTMPGPYDLLPSQAYFAHVTDSVASFYSGGVTGAFFNGFPGGITSFSDLVAFVTDAYGLDTQIVDPEELNVPIALSPSFVSKAALTHNALDGWTPPAGMQVTAIAGWGQLTTYSYRYAPGLGHLSCEGLLGNFICSRAPSFVHTQVKNKNGDDTVVTTSATGTLGNIYYFNAEKFNSDGFLNIVHQDLTSAFPIQDVISDLLKGKPINGPYITNVTPTSTEASYFAIGSMSPANILTTDSNGNETGIVPVPGKPGIYFSKHDIPESAVDVSGAEKFVYLPQGSGYSVSIQGYASGPANIVVENIDSDGNITSSTTVADIPVATSTAISLNVDSAGAPTIVSIDLNGDGTVDATVTPQVGQLTSFTTAVDPLDYITFMETQMDGMPLDPKIEKQLFAKLTNVSHLIQRDNKWDSSDEDRDDSPRGMKLDQKVQRRLDKLAAYVIKQENKSQKANQDNNKQKGIPIDSASQILDMINELRSLTSNI